MRRLNPKHAELKVEVMRNYSTGEPRCACCGEKELTFLTIDHVAENGAAERRNLRQGGNKKRTWTGYAFYRWLKQRNYPSGYQVLCSNCNLGKEINGACPHQSKKAVIVP